MKQRTKTIQALAAAVLLPVLLAACGGGDEGLRIEVRPPVTGWSGTTDTRRDVTAVTLPDGNYWLMYSAAGDANTVGGVVQGTASRAGTAFSSSDALDFSAEGAGIRASTVAATLDPARTFTGTVATTATGAQVAFDTHALATAGIPHSLEALAGSYTGTAGFALGVRPATFNVTATGAVTSTINGCAITGTAAPRSDSDVYDLNLAFGGAPCALPGLAFSGIAYLRTDNGRLYAAARNTATRQSVIFNGGRP